jgi:transposase
MSAESIKTINKPTKPIKTRKRKLNTTKVITLYNQGVIPSDIAKQQGVAISTITRYLQSIKPQLQEIQTYS